MIITGKTVCKKRVHGEFSVLKSIFYKHKTALKNKVLGGPNHSNQTKQKQKKEKRYPNGEMNLSSLQVRPPLKDSKEVTVK